MIKQQKSTPFLPLTFDPISPIPLYRQLYKEIRQAILQGKLVPGTQLPSTRVLANSLGISRTTVVQAFEDLLSDGYVESKMGSGTYIASVFPEDLLQVPPQTTQVSHSQQQGRRLSQRGEILAATDVATVHYYSEALAFRPGIPDLEQFPFDTWIRLAVQRWRHSPRDLLGYTHPAGYFPLRAEIAAYLKVARGVRCETEQVIITSGSQQAINLAARVLLDPGDAVWMEDPGHPSARSAFLGSGAQVVPVTVDAEGLDIAAGIAQQPDACMVYVTPSFQFPLGTILSPARRSQLLQWASSTTAYILEDDYDGEYRYTGIPLPALQGLDTTGRVIYIGTFSKVLFPGLRLGYLIVPPDLVDAFTAARAVADRHSPILDQIVLADFINQGHFTRHIRRMRGLYAERQAYLIDVAKRELDGLLTLRGAEAGMHLVATLADGINDQEASQQAALHRLIAPSLSTYSMAPPRRNGLLLGYTAISIREIHEGVCKLARALSKMK